jgi:chromosomal replication initiator protein
MMQPGDTAVADPSTRESEILREFEQRIGSRTFNLWVRDNASIEIAQDQVTVNVHNKFLLSWLQQRYRAAIVQSVQVVLGDAVAVLFRELPARAAQTTGAMPSHEIHDEAPPRPADQPEPPPAPCQTERIRSQVPVPVAPTVGGGQGSAAGPNLFAAIPITEIALACLQNSNSESGRDCGAKRPEKSAAGAPPALSKTAGVAASASDRQPNASQPVNSPPTRAQSGRRFADLNDFVTGPGNHLAFSAALQICEQPGSYNPLVLHGGVGIGKTHLLEGVYRRMRVLRPSFRVMFLSAESFANYFTQALRDRTLASFRQRFRGVDVLMIDDVDFLDGKRVIQEEFLHTVKQLESHGRQVALTADRHPRLLTRLSEELVTRFMSGIVCRLESPDIDTRRTIVARKAARMTVRITDDAIEFVVQRFALSVRELEGALNFLENYGQTTGKTINLTVARTMLADLDRDCTRIVRVAEVEQAVCRLFSVGTDDLRSPRRTRTFSQPRMLAMYLARKMTQAAYTEIGEHFGGRNHSTVMSAEKRVRTLLEADATVRAGSQDWKLGDLLASLEQQLLTG